MTQPLPAKQTLSHLPLIDQITVRFSLWKHKLDRTKGYHPASIIGRTLDTLDLKAIDTAISQYQQEYECLKEQLIRAGNPNQDLETQPQFSRLLHIHKKIKSLTRAREELAVQIDTDRQLLNERVWFRDTKDWIRNKTGVKPYQDPSHVGLKSSLKQKQSSTWSCIPYISDEEAVASKLEQGVTFNSKVAVVSFWEDEEGFVEEAGVTEVALDFTEKGTATLYQQN
ncbi:hypothetical protein BDR26DRAFT_853260 [Obelidium mucronatum]|nr:hypothetical protein BDR26DRAFT_853260 [Obelidium mucronatum]